MRRDALGPLASNLAWLAVLAAVLLGCLLAYRWPPSNEFVWQGHYHWRPVRPRTSYP